MVFTCIWDSSPSICSKDSPIHNNHSTSSLLQPENYSKKWILKFYKQSTKELLSISEKYFYFLQLEICTYLHETIEEKDNTITRSLWNTYIHVSRYLATKANLINLSFTHIFRENNSGILSVKNCFFLWIC